MRHRLISPFVIGVFFAVALYTTNGCGGTVTSPQLHTGTLTGVVTDAVSGQPIAAAAVSVQAPGQSVFMTNTGNNGRYTAGGFPVGDVHVGVTATGYQPFSATKGIVEGTNTLDVPLRLASP